jgi:hypothetical protein
MDDLHCDERNRAMDTNAVSNQELETRLGSPQAIAKAAEMNLPRATFARRHPVVTFLLLPVPVFLLFCVGYCFALVGMFQLFEDYKSQVWAIQTARFLSHGLAYAPAIVLVLLIARVAHRCEAKLAWSIAASIIVGLVSAMLMVTFRAPTAPGNGMLQIGLGFPPAPSSWPQFAIPLLVTLVFVIGTLVMRRATLLRLSRNL